MNRMRLALSLAVLCPCLALSLRAQDATQTADAPSDNPPVIVKTETLPSVILDKGPHQQTIQTMTLLTDSSGVVTTNVSSVVALGTGLNYFDPAQKDWVPAIRRLTLFQARRRPRGCNTPSRCWAIRIKRAQSGSPCPKNQECPTGRR